MFTLGILIGLYAFSIFILGLLGALYMPIVLLFTLLFILASIVFWRKNIHESLSTNGIRSRIVHSLLFLKKDSISLFLFALLLAQVVINFLGVIGPELGFDALWYHLTIPKLYLISHGISYIPGGLLYYSAMPKLIELLYTGGLAFGSFTIPKFIHFGFGILTLPALYVISRKYFSKRMSLVTLVIFYSNLVVGWESISAYIDLGRTFFELLSVWAFLEWEESKEKKWFIYAAIFLGFSIMTKLLALGSLVIMLILIGLVLKRMKKDMIKSLCIFVGIALLVPLPWFVFAYINTGNPLFPFFSHTYPVLFSLQLFNPLYIFSSFWNLFLFSADPLNPIYLIMLPLLVIFWKRWTYPLRLLFLYMSGALFFWYITPHTGGGRFILPYLPILSLLCTAGILSLPQKKLKQFLLLVIGIIAVSSVCYRAIANAKFLPVITGNQSEAQFLSSHLNFSFGDFYDTDGYFKSHIKPTDTVLLYGFHNLAYVNFPFIDSSFVKKGDVFTYIAVENGKLPKRFQTWNLIYINPTTRVALYSAGGIPWVY